MAKRRNLRDEEGAAIVIVAASMLVIMGMAALVIDLGNGWRTRRALIPATDAAALAAAQAYVDGETGCDIAPDYLTYNEAAATLVSCDKVDIDDDRGRVTVTASHNVETWFASVIGLGDFTVGSVSTAAWAPPGGIRGLRPIGLCLNAPGLEAILESPPDPDTEEIIEIAYDKDQEEDCGGDDIPGNWGSIDFDGGENSEADAKKWITNGYPDLIYVADEEVSSCVDEPHCYQGDTGALAGINKELTALKKSGDPFTLPIFNYVEDPGANARFHLVGVARVRLLEFQVATKDSKRYFLLAVQPGLISGTCCDGGGGATGGNKVIAICGVDPGDFEACDP